MNIHAKRLLKILEVNDSFTHRFLTVPLSNISPKECLLWTIGLIEDELKTSSDNELSD